MEQVIVSFYDIVAIGGFVVNGIVFTVIYYMTSGGPGRDNPYIMFRRIKQDVLWLNHAITSFVWAVVVFGS